MDSLYHDPKPWGRTTRKLQQENADLRRQLERFHEEILELEELKAENERLGDLCRALENLLSCYRLGHKPTGKLLDDITRLKDAAPPGGGHR